MGNRSFASAEPRCITGVTHRVHSRQTATLSGGTTILRVSISIKHENSFLILPCGRVPGSFEMTAIIPNRFQATAQLQRYTRTRYGLKLVQSALRID